MWNNGQDALEQKLDYVSEKWDLKWEVVSESS